MRSVCAGGVVQHANEIILMRSRLNIQRPMINIWDPHITEDNFRITHDLHAPHDLAAYRDATHLAFMAGRMSRSALPGKRESLSVASLCESTP